MGRRTALDKSPGTEQSVAHCHWGGCSRPPPLLTQGEHGLTDPSGCLPALLPSALVPGLLHLRPAGQAAPPATYRLQGGRGTEQAAVLHPGSQVDTWAPLPASSLPGLATDPGPKDTLCLEGASRGPTGNMQGWGGWLGGWQATFPVLGYGGRKEILPDQAELRF